MVTVTISFAVKIEALVVVPESRSGQPSAVQPSLRPLGFFNIEDVENLVFARVFSHGCFINLKNFREQFLTGPDI